MVNKRFWLIILVMILVFGMTFVGCDNDPDNGNGNSNGGGGGSTDPALNGTWVRNDNFEINFNNGNAESFSNGSPYEKWTYTTNNGKITEKTTHLHGKFWSSYGLEDRWYTINELRALINAGNNIPSDFLVEHTYDYSISGNILIFTSNVSTNRYTRK